MARNFRIDFNFKDENLYFRPCGLFDGSSAWELVNLIHDKYQGKGNVFVDTVGLSAIMPYGAHIFKNHLKKQIVPGSKLYFVGTKGYELAAPENYVLAERPKASCTCGSKCKNCGGGCSRQNPEGKALAAGSPAGHVSIKSQ